MSAAVVDLISDSEEEINLSRGKPVKMYQGNTERPNIGFTGQGTLDGKKKRSQKRKRNSKAMSRDDSKSPLRKKLQLQVKTNICKSENVGGVSDFPLIKSETLVKEEDTVIKQLVKQEKKISPKRTGKPIVCKTSVKKPVKLGTQKTRKTPKTPKKGVSRKAKSATMKPKTSKKCVVSVDKQQGFDFNMDVQVIGNKEFDVEWDVNEVVSESLNLQLQVAKNVIHLLDEDNTIPFIARYRKELTGNMEPEKLRHVKETYELLKAVKQKAAFVEKCIMKQNALTPAIEKSLRCARTMNELEYLYAPYKTGKCGSKAEKARQLGLEPVAMAILNGSDVVDPVCLLKPGVKGISTLNEVELALQYILADVISKDKEVLDLLRTLCCRNDCKIMMTAKAAKKNTKNLNNKEVKEREKLQSKFQNYFKFKCEVQSVKPHQVLAINRGESLKVLSVKVLIPDWIFAHLKGYCYNRWFSRGMSYPFRAHLMEISLKDSYERLIEPLLIRQVRSQLSQQAACASVEVFAQNLKKLLLCPPFRGKIILAIDPGFTHGCKIAVISSTGNVLSTEVLHINFNQLVKKEEDKSDTNAHKLREMLLLHKCEHIALGNGSGCRETESYLSSLVQKGWFHPLDVKYTIVNEQGASIYSCSSLAKKEFPDMDPNMISAVSLGRRLQDPLCELVKVEPKHLGVGMYQHDVPEKQLNSTLDEVVSECVSFVGVDLNTASESILRRIAGLNSSRAAKIVEWRSEHGPFVNRSQLMQVKGIGDKTFEQCAGFVRINPSTSQCSNAKTVRTTAALPGSSKKKKVVSDTNPNPFDQTCIHPESYVAASRFVDRCDVLLEDLGKPEFISKVKTSVQRKGVAVFSKELGISEPQMNIIIDALQTPLDHDLRSQFEEPLFRRTIQSLEDLKLGSFLTGRVDNVTHFGTFVDIGVGTVGLIHIKNLRKFSVMPEVGNRVEVRVLGVEVDRKRISLDLVRIV